MPRQLRFPFSSANVLPSKQERNLRPMERYRAMKKQLALFAAANLLFAASQLPAQTTGTSHPEAIDETITVSQPAKPSPAVPVAQPQLYTHETTVASTTPLPAPAPIVRADVASSSADGGVVGVDENSGVVINVPSSANALPEGTMIRVALSQEISTRETEPNIRFSATTTEPVVKDGRVVIPAGAVLTGRITELNEGRHLRKAAAIHLQPEFITLPNGTHYKFTGQVIDLVSDNHAKVSREGTILANDPTPGTATAVGVATGAGAVTGAVLGGGVGAVVGAGIGAGVSGAVWANQPTTNTLRAGTRIIFALNQPMLLENIAITD